MGSRELQKVSTKMRPFKGTISLDEARTIIDGSILPITRVARVDRAHRHTLSAR